ncbi:hypothetical protein HMPREF0388_0123 [Mobiluncus curtisii ATCC 51333]|uniref:Uncharacterized protein n=1 Tax=Mobiluncus curtisii ATCC 51333 TaxID=887326 RepID=E6LW86_9ACTO|nr:hypothetical protein HMPREF0388_0123 [Mobiluncus curtisii ATCC 51333]
MKLRAKSSRVSRTLSRGAANVQTDRFNLPIELQTRQFFEFFTAS